MRLFSITVHLTLVMSVLTLYPPLQPHPNTQVHWVEEFYVYGNRVSTLPHEVCNLKKLRKLAVNENLLGSLPGLLLGLCSIYSNTCLK